MHLDRRWFTLFACIAALALCGCGREDETAAGGELEFRGWRDAGEIDFGAVLLPDGTASRTLEVHNPGDERVELSIAGIAAPFSAEPGEKLTVPPRGTRELTFHFAPGEAGVFRANLAFRHGGHEHPAVLRGSGVEPDLRCTPVVDFGALEFGQALTATATCTNETDVPMELHAGAIAGEAASYFSHGLAERPTLPGRATLTLPITFTNGAVRGSSTAQLPILVGDRMVQTIELRARSLPTALELPSSCLDFGVVPADLVVEKPLAIRNLGSLALTIEAVEILEGAGYQVVTPLPLVVPPDDPETEEVRENEGAVVVRFVPTGIGDAAGRLRIRSSSPGKPVTEQAICGLRGGPQLACEASAIDFGTVAVGIPRTERVTCINAGSSDPRGQGRDTLFIEGLEAGSPHFSARIVDAAGLPGPESGGYAPGDSFQIEVTWNPAAAGEEQAELAVRSNDPLTPELRLPLRGESRVLAPCQLGRSDEPLDFGVVGPGRSLDLSFEMRNDGADDCLIRDLRVDATAGFTLPQGAEALLLAAGERRLIPVRFTAPSAPAATGQVTGTLRFGVSDPERPERTIALRATVAPPCLVATPALVDLGIGEPGCAPREREVRLVNRCDTPIAITAIETGATGSCTAGCPFAVEAAPGVPFGSIPAGARIHVRVTYQPEQVGEDAGALVVRVADAPAPYLVPLVGRSSMDRARIDRFVEPDPPKIDVLWVIDNSCGAPEQALIASHLDFFLAAAQAANADFHLGITTTDTGISDGNPNATGGRLVPVDAPRSDRILIRDHPDLAARWAATVVGLGIAGSGDEKGILAAKQALSPGLIDRADHPGTPSLPDDGNLGFLRADAALAIVFASNAADQDWQPTANYLDFFRGIKGHENPHLLRFHGIISDPGVGCPTDAADGTGERYHELIAATGGVWQSWCSSDWAQVMRTIGQGVFGELGIEYGLSDKPLCPACADAIAVRVNGRYIGRIGPNGLSNWRYDPVDNRIVFNTDNFRPAVGSEVEVAYEAACN